MKKHVIGFIRLSSEEQASEGRAGLLRQRTDIAAASRLHDLDVVRVVELLGVSGADVLGNAEFRAMLRDMERADIAGVVTSAVDRLTRPDTLGALAVFDPFQRYQKLVFTAGQVIDLNTDGGFLLSGLLGMLGGIERRAIRKRCVDGKRELKKRGGNPNGPASLPSGVMYDKTTGKWSIDPVWRSKIERAYEMLFRRASYAEIGEKVFGGAAAISVRRWLENPIWCGTRRYEWERKDKRNVRVNDPLEVEIEIDPVISRARWQEAQAIIRGKKDNWRKLKKPPRFLVSSLVRCGVCGAALYLRCASDPKSHDRYYCSTGHPGRGPKCGASSVRREWLDAAVVQGIEECTRDADALLSMLEAIAEENAQPDGAAKAAQSLAKLEAKRARLTDLAVDGLLGKEEFSKRLRILDGQIRDAQALITPKAAPVDMRRVAAALRRTFGRFGKLPFVQQRDLLRRAATEIVVGAELLLTFRGGFLGEIAGVNSLQHLKRWCWRRCRWRASAGRRGRRAGFYA
jgi:DNA invertase Pin-like site-specific DNA recombinase